MTTVILPNATDAASFEADLDQVSNGAASTNYIIPITAAVTIANTDADTNTTTNTQVVILPSGSTVTLEGSGSLTITPPDSLFTDGTVAIDVPVTGEIVPYAGPLSIDPPTTDGTASNGSVNGSIISSTAALVQNYGQIEGTGSNAIYLGGGEIDNAATGTITDAVSGAFTVDFEYSGAVVNNAGTISATGASAYGAVFFGTGALTNGGFGGSTQAVISATYDAVIFATAGSVTNDGVISSSGSNAVEVGSTATVTNGSATDAAAMISSTGTTGAGIDAGDGSVTNFATIQGGVYGVEFIGDNSGSAGNVVNTGTISATDATNTNGAGIVVAGVALASGGNVTNGPSNGTVAGSATISGTDIGVYVLSGASTITNSGTISGTTGIEFRGSSANATGTVIDSGAITSTAGASGTAIDFGTGAEKLTLNQGFAITGVVKGGANTGDTTAIEVGAGTSGTFSGLTGGAGTVTNGGGSSTNGFTFTNVQTVDIDSSASWAFTGTNALATLRVDGTAQVASGILATTLDPAGTGGVLTVAAGATLEVVAATGAGDTIQLAGAGAVLKIDTANSFGTTTGSTYTGDVIGQFASGSAIDLADVSYASLTTKSFNATTDVLTLSDGTHTANIAFAPGIVSSINSLSITNGVGGIMIAVACYCPGTRIATPNGEIEVEKLAIGDLVTMLDGRAEPIRWIGRRSYAGRFLAANPKVHPIRFRKGSLGRGVPRRDLLVSPEHAMFINGVLVPAHCLVNGSLIAVDTSLKSVDYIHIEFANHEVVLAEGAASESFVDDDSRAMFHNASEYAELYPNAPAASGFFAERMDGGFEVEAIRAKLAEIADRAASRRMTRKLKAA